MVFDRLVHPWLYLAAIAYLEGMAIYIWRYRSIPGAKALFIRLPARMTWLASFLFIDANTDITLKLWGVKIYFMAAFIVTASWLALSLQLFDRKKPLIGYRRFSFPDRTVDILFPDMFG